jgi:hypothetical protein
VLVLYGGGDGHPSDAMRLAAWADRCAVWAENGCREIHFLVHQPDSVRTPTTCRDFIDACARRNHPLLTPPRSPLTLF